MSKRRMLMLFEKSGRGRSGLAAALPGSVIADQEVCFLGRVSNRPVQEPRSEELRKLIGGPLPVRQAIQPCRQKRRVEAPQGLLVNKRVTRHAGAWHLEAEGNLSA